MIKVPLLSPDLYIILHCMHLLLTNMMQDNDLMWCSLWMHLYAPNIQDVEVVWLYKKCCMGFGLVFISYANQTSKSAVFSPEYL